MLIRLWRFEVRFGAKTRPPIKHGTRSGYERGCRCGPCVEARRLYQAAYMARKRSEGRWK